MPIIRSSPLKGRYDDRVAEEFKAKDNNREFSEGGQLRTEEDKEFWYEYVEEIQDKSIDFLEAEQARLRLVYDDENSPTQKQDWLKLRAINAVLRKLAITNI